MSSMVKGLIIIASNFLFTLAAGVIAIFHLFSKHSLKIALYTYIVGWVVLVTGSYVLGTSVLKKAKRHYYKKLRR